MWSAALPSIAGNVICGSRPRREFQVHAILRRIKRRVGIIVIRNGITRGDVDRSGCGWPVSE
jgi:hypothetical protein